MLSNNSQSLPQNNLLSKTTWWVIILFIYFLSACSQTGETRSTNNNDVIKSSSKSIEKTKDPYEKFNRRIYRVNMSLDGLLLKPIAKAYHRVTPEIIDNSITNFFLNIEDIRTSFYNVLQLKPEKALIDIERVVFNSSFGIGGLFDVATKMGIEKHDEDFGQTLAYWGVPSGPYIMLPAFGPSTLRDATGKLTIDRLTNLTSYSNNSLYFFVVKNLDKRADLLSTEDAFKDISDDSYSALRDAWLQRRDYLIRDGKGDGRTEDDFIDELEALDDQ